jgi:hypothetical protein
MKEIMNYSITKIHEGLYILVLVNFPEDEIDSLYGMAVKNGTMIAEVRQVKSSYCNYSVFEIFGKNIESTLEIITNHLNELIL